MLTLGRSISITGELRTSEDLKVEGRIDGPLACEGAAVVISPGATVTGQIIARDITICGCARGQLIATGVVDVRAHAVVTGQVIARRFVLRDGASFNGRVSPQQLEAALGIARFNRRQRDVDFKTPDVVPPTFPAEAKLMR
jgi:cytoskeletal protein CcmA (bactofilin family)